MNFERVQFALTSDRNLGILIFTELKGPTRKIKEFMAEGLIKEEFKIVKTNLGLGLICPDLKQQKDLYFAAGVFWKLMIEELGSPVEIFE